MYDIAIIGAGVVGAMIARELSKYDISICLVEKESDVAMGATKANSAIVHAGYDAKVGSLKAALNVKGNKLMQKITDQLGVPFKRIGSLVVAFNQKDMEHINILYKRGLENNVEGLSIITKQQVKSIEPNISNNVIGALYASSAGITCPYELTIAAAENAVENGVELKLEYDIKDIQYNSGYFTLISEKENIKSKCVINVAGINSDIISQMLDEKYFSITPRRGEYILLDKNQGDKVNTVIFRTPTEKGKGILVTPTVDGNLLIGPTSQEIDYKDDVSTTADGLNHIIESASQCISSINMKEVITSFAGLRATPSGEDFIIESLPKNKHFINVAGIESPGLTAAPAIAEYVSDILKSTGLKMENKKTFNPIRKTPYRFSQLNDIQRKELIQKDNRYGNIVCRCEMVTEGEIIDAICRPVGARSLDAVKRRTRAGMGRCQSGFCAPLIVKILSEQLKIPLTEVTKNGAKSKILVDKEL